MLQLYCYFFKEDDTMTTEEILTTIYHDNITLLQHKRYEPYYAESLLKGPWGALLYVFYYERQYNVQDPLAGDLLQQLYQDLQPEPVTGYDYCSGATGPFWVLQHLHAHEFIDIDMDMLLTDFLPAAITDSEQCLHKKDFDFLYGSAGICHFLIPYAAQPAVAAHLQQFVDTLAAAAVPAPGGLSLPVFTMDQPDQPGVDAFSMAHGTCGLLVLLAKIYCTGIATGQCRRLITDCIAFIKSKQLPRSADHQRALFPGMLDGRSDFSRLSWCYGDLSVALACWYCGKHLQESAWMDEALDIMHYNTKRISDKAAGVVDSCLCHGSGGIAAFYNRFWHETKDPAFLQCAQHWYNNTLEKVIFSGQPGVHGMRGWIGAGKDWEYCWDVLDGSTGVGLSLLSYQSNIPPAWDEMLMLS